MVALFIRGMDEKPPINGVTEGHHGLTHHGRNPAKIEQLKIVERLEMAVFRDFLLSLRDTKEGGSLLDSTQVLIGSNLGDASGHGTTNLPILLAGGGYKHGQHIAGDRRTTPRWPNCSSTCCNDSGSRPTRSVRVRERSQAWRDPHAPRKMPHHRRARGLDRRLCNLRQQRSGRRRLERLYGAVMPVLAAALRELPRRQTTRGRTHARRPGHA